MTKICVYEDNKYRQFFPVTHLRPVFCMRAGILPQFRRVGRAFDTDEIWLAARNCLAALVTAEHRDYPVNLIKRGEDDRVLFINGRIRNFGDLPRLVQESRLSTVFKNNGEIVAVLLHPDSASQVPSVATPGDYVPVVLKDREEIPDFDTSATLYSHCWEFVEDISRSIAEDFEYMRTTGVQTNQQAADVEGLHVVNSDSVILGVDVQTSPGSVIDASNGPVYIGDNTMIESQVAIHGPCYIGPNSVVVTGKIVSSSVGHTCRVGGEVEESIFQSYVNKHHAGFIGHSYVGSWVNFGAMTTNSDLKNNYSNIRVTVDGQSIDTGSIKVGSFIGDHTKFGIGTLLTTGINIGACCNIFGGNLVGEKEIPSFSWGGSAPYEKYFFDKAIETASRTAKRRDVELSHQEEEVLRQLSEGSNPDEGTLDFEN